ncbi:hypothetical protein M426DRAFT_11996 [Hypoxylon sp. CI-4A]|nr:hypothetical protein M426DRAFT_11996 [Hypoxylon sp. CI-4A]
MAAISMVGTKTLCAIPEPGKYKRPSAHDIEFDCIRFCSDQVKKGGLWTALGVYLKGPRGTYLKINNMAGYRIWRLVDCFERALNIHAKTQVLGQNLSEEDEKIIDLQLARAWVYRCVRIIEYTHDESSGTEVFVNEKEELLDVESIRKSVEESRCEHRFAIYNELLEKDVEGGDSYLEARGLTLMHEGVFESAQKMKDGEEYIF